jgi:hypothetical protein
MPWLMVTLDEEERICARCNLKEWRIPAFVNKFKIGSTVRIRMPQRFAVSVPETEKEP